MNVIDIVILLLLFISSVSGFIKGFILSIASFIGFFLGIIVSFRLAGSIQELLMAITGSDGRYLYVVGFLLCFALVVALVHLIGKIIEKGIKMVALGFLNRIAGAAFGALRSLLILSALIYALSYIDPEDRLITVEQQEGSVFYQPLEKILPALSPFIRHSLDEIGEML